VWCGNFTGDVLLAFELNNAPIPEMLGGPLRAVIPGHAGVRNAKWVNSGLFVSTCDGQWCLYYDALLPWYLR
jgi:hypothetical protein